MSLNLGDRVQVCLAWSGRAGKVIGRFSCTVVGVCDAEHLLLQPNSMLSLRCADSAADGSMEFTQIEDEIAALLASRLPTPNDVISGGRCMSQTHLDRDFARRERE